MRKLALYSYRSLLVFLFPVLFPVKVDIFSGSWKVRLRPLRRRASDRGRWYCSKQGIRFNKPPVDQRRLYRRSMSPLPSKSTLSSSSSTSPLSCLNAPFEYPPFEWDSCGQTHLSMLFCPPTQIAVPSMPLFSSAPCIISGVQWSLCPPRGEANIETWTGSNSCQRCGVLLPGIVEEHNSTLRK